MKLSPPLVLCRAGLAWQYTTGEQLTRTGFARLRPGYLHAGLTQERPGLTGLKGSFPI